MRWDEDIDALAWLMKRQGLGVARIAQALDMSRSTVIRHLGASAMARMNWDRHKHRSKTFEQIDNDIMSDDRVMRALAGLPEAAKPKRVSGAEKRRMAQLAEVWLKRNQPTRKP
jgi:hypothetical protein